MLAFTKRLREAASIVRSVWSLTRSKLRTRSGGETVVVLQATELALHGCPAAIQVAALRVAPDAREQPTAKRERERWLVRSSVEPS